MQIQVASRSFGSVETEKQIVQDAVQEYQRDKKASKPSTPATSRPATSAPEQTAINQVVLWVEAKRVLILLAG